jgi:hypothetical protein
MSNIYKLLRRKVMNAQVQKPFEEILGYLEGKKRIFLMGCGGCATIFHTGGIKEVGEMAERLTKQGKEIVGKIELPLAVFTCYLPMSSMFLKEHRSEIEECDAILMQSCGDGAQAVRGYLEEEMGIVKPLYPSNNAIGFSSGGPGSFKEECQACGECELGRAAGICPLVQCPKGLLNGPCGGTTTDGKCEVDTTRECAWVMIYKRLGKLGELDELSEIQAPHDWSKAIRPRTLEVEPIDLLEELKGTKKVLEALGV